jgi:23S rRNA pseudouridine1911/1915/1917 synthase
MRRRVRVEHPPGWKPGATGSPPGGGFRALEVPDKGAGMRLDRFLSRWFADYSRSALARGIKAGLVTDEEGKPLRASQTVRTGDRLRIWIPGLAPGTEAPPFPPILFEDDRLVVIDKPAGLLTHPAGNEFAWAVISLAKERWPEADLVHRIDKDTSGILVISKDPETNRLLKAAFHDDRVDKEYEALCRGTIPWEEAVLEGPIGPADGPIRIQMAVRPDGQEAHTTVRVLGRNGVMTRVRCRIRTGRTHQIRVHLAHAGFSLVGDRLYGVPPEVFLHAWEQGADDSTIEAAGAPRQALHAAKVTLPHPDGRTLVVECPFPEDLERWWRDPSVLPFDRPAGADDGATAG